MPTSIRLANDMKNVANHSGRLDNRKAPNDLLALINKSERGHL
jgi:hypothetical protein